MLFEGSASEKNSSEKVRSESFGGCRRTRQVEKERLVVGRIWQVENWFGKLRVLLVGFWGMGWRSADFDVDVEGRMDGEVDRVK
jgi:hypothetical protein